jgi:hypothetical protein
MPIKMSHNDTRLNKPVLTIRSGNDTPLTDDEKIQATLDYIDFMEDITEGLEIETDIEEKLEKLPELARDSADDLLLKRVDSKIIEHCRKTKGLYAAGIKAIRQKRFEKAIQMADDLLDQQEYHKALSLAEKIAAEKQDPDYVKGVQTRIQGKKETCDQQLFKDQLQNDYNRYGLVYVVRSPDPSFQGAYFLQSFGTENMLARNYSIIDGFEYIGITLKSDFLLRFKAYEPRRAYQNPELIARLYHMYRELDETAQKKAVRDKSASKVHPFVESRLINPVRFSDILDNFIGFSLVAVNEKNKALLVTDPIVRCVKRVISP